MRAHFIDTFLKPSGALDKWKGAWEMVIRRRQGGEHFLRIIRKKKVQKFISMRYRGRVLINAPEEELPLSTMALQVMGREIELWDTDLSFCAHRKRHSKPKRGPFSKAKSIHQRQECAMGRGSASHLGHGGVGWFHGTVDINAPPELEVNNSAHSITFRGSCAHTSRAAVVTLTFTFGGWGGKSEGAIWMV